jgi:hypothetical protein
MFCRLWRSDLVVVCLIALIAIALGSGLAEAEAAPADSPTAESAPGSDQVSTAHRWHTPRRGERLIPRPEVGPLSDDWGPLARPTAKVKGFLKRGGITTDRRGEDAQEFVDHALQPLAAEGVILGAPGRSYPRRSRAQSVSGGAEALCARSRA